ncbi:hypothetical protein NDU88_001670 [Pleurodeles waltl]|uniref:Uncharacterized protein n=1 Tax=Pleurodeles waltl TaxID=8319 RepID=A0AAV7M083_PLEWA|nr:hypothetical protein NDU88_001670 [Pleurodeles waltl]
MDDNCVSVTCVLCTEKYGVADFMPPNKRAADYAPLGRVGRSEARVYWYHTGDQIMNKNALVSAGGSEEMLGQCLSDE